MPHLVIRSASEADDLMRRVRESAKRLHDRLAALNGDPLDVLRRLKFETIGCHPVEDRPLNAVEQINQTWTFAVAIAAVKRLLVLHPTVGGFRLAPGAHAALKLDIMSIEENQVGAETFAAVTPGNNEKLKRELDKLGACREVLHRYVFFMSPTHPGTMRRQDLERDGIQVWSVDV